MQHASDMMTRHAGSSVFRMRPNHGIAFLDIKISTTQLARLKACFVEEAIAVDGNTRTVLLPVSSDNMLDNGSAWHPETFQPIGPDEAIWLNGYAGIRPFVGHWTPLPYLRTMTTLSGTRPHMDKGPQNWVRVFINPPEGRLEDVDALDAVLAIDTRLAGDSRLDQRRYNAPSLDDVTLGSTFVLADAAEQISDLLSAAWLNSWLRETLRRDAAWHTAQAASETESTASFEQEHIARYLFMLKVLCEACPAPILRFANQARETAPIEPVSHELILDLADDVGLAVLASQPSKARAAKSAGNRVLPIRDLSQPINVHSGALPVRVEFDTATFGLPHLSRQSGRTDAFNWPSLVRIGKEASRIALRPNAITGTTGCTGLVRAVQDAAPTDAVWRNSSDTAAYSKLGQPSRSLALQYFDESGTLRNGQTPARPSLRPRFSRSSLLALFIAELVMHAISHLNTPRDTETGDAADAQPGILNALRLSLPISIEAGEREAILARAKEGIDFAWRAQGWENDPSDLAPPKPRVELGLGGDFGTQFVYLQDQLGAVYGGDLAALVEDLNPVRRPHNGTGQVLQFASISLGMSATRVVVADYSLFGKDGIRPRLVAARTEADGLDDVHGAIIEHYLMPAVRAALRRCNPHLAAGVADALLGRQPSRSEATQDTGLPDDIVLRLDDKILRPAARSLLDHYAGSPAGGAGIERLTLAGLAARGGGRLKPMDDVINTVAAKLGADGFRLGEVVVPFARHTFRKSIRAHLASLIDLAATPIDASQTDLILVSSAYAATQDVRDQILSRIPISPHRLIMLNEDWSAENEIIDHADDLDISARIGVISTVIGQHRRLNYEGLAGIKQAAQLGPVVA